MSPLTTQSSSVGDGGGGEKCERCGGSEFTMSETDAFAVCVGCGTQARETINTAWNDWAEEQGTYGSFAARGGVRVRRLRRNRRGAKAKPVKPTLSLRLDGYGRVCEAVTMKLVQGGVDPKLTGAVSSLWAMYREQLEANASLSVAAKRYTPVLSTKPKAVKDRALKKRRREEAPQKEEKEQKEQKEELELDLVASLSLDSVLACVYAAARIAGVTVAAAEIIQACWQGALPYLDAWTGALTEDGRRALGPMAMHEFSPRTVPLASSMALVAEIVFLRVHGGSFEAPDTPGLLRRLGTAIGSSSAAVAEALRLLEAASTEDKSWSSETRLLALLVEGARRTKSFRLKVQTVPWTEQEAESFPSGKKQIEDYLAFADRFLYERIPEHGDMSRASVVFSNAMRMHATPATLFEEHEEAVEEGTVEGVVQAAARFAECPPAVFAAELEFVKAIVREEH